MTPQEREIALRKKAEKKNRNVEEVKEPEVIAPQPRTRRARAAKAV